jgi:hypothetical protein
LIRIAKYGPIQVDAGFDSAYEAAILTVSAYGQQPTWNGRQGGL